MIRRTPLDDESVERLFAGQRVTDEEMLSSFVADTKFAAATQAPRPSAALAAFFAEDLSFETSHLATSAIVATDVARQVSTAPKRRKNMLEIALAKLAALGLAAKVGAATGALALTGTAAAMTGTLPAPVADAIERTGIQIPGGRSADHRQDAEHRQDGTDAEDVEANDADGNAPAEADFGNGVADDAKNGAPQEDGAQFGKDVSTDARDTYQPATPTADSNPGTDFKPEPTPTADDNPGTEYQPEPTPTADSNPGTEYQPETAPTAEDNPGTSARP